MKRILFFLALLPGSGQVLAQHEHHQSGQAPPAPKPKSDPAKRDTTPPMRHEGMNHSTMNHDGMNHAATPTDSMNHVMTPGGMGHEGMSEGVMSHAFSLSLPMNRNGSGTGWLPDATPLYAYMKHTPKWMLMLHGSVFLRYTATNLNNSDKRGRNRFSAPNWAMGMAQRQVGKNGLFMARLMVSLDPVTEGGRGYPLLFQTGESYEGQPIVDGQHPHDIVSELAVGYTQRLSPKADLSLYLGYPGEPALGPTAFMHRISAFSNPDAALGHHWQDATHITFGVATLGFRYGKFKLEGSSFTGREPDENRSGFDKPRFDSYSARLQFAPSAAWAVQVSRGLLKNPEVLHPGDVTRTTASAIHSRALRGPNRFWTSALVWGMNEGEGHAEHSFLAETNVQLDRWTVYGRYEFVQKSAEELFSDSPEGAGFSEDRLFNVNAFSLGLNRQVAYFANTMVHAGVQATVHATDRALEPAYGKSPVSAQVYLRLMPGLLRMNHGSHKM